MSKKKSWKGWTRGTSRLLLQSSWTYCTCRGWSSLWSGRRWDSPPSLWVWGLNWELRVLIMSEDFWSIYNLEEPEWFLGISALYLVQLSSSVNLYWWTAISEQSFWLLPWITKCNYYYRVNYSVNAKTNNQSRNKNNRQRSDIIQGMMYF
jgi:hypothetical protein